ncbi:MAG: hypothetical protein ACTH07_07155 [Microbacterium sp.]
MGTATALAAAVVSAGAVATPAQAATAQAQVEYICASAPTGHPELTADYTMTVAVELDVPGEVAAGSALDVSGTASFQMSESIRSLASTYFSTIRITTDTLTFPVTVNGQTTSVSASPVDTGAQPTSGNPLVVSDSVTADPITVPADATGNVTIELPHGEIVSSPLTDGDVAFTAQMAMGGGGTFPEVVTDMACRAPADAALTIASIPVAGTDPEPEPGANSSTSDINVAVPEVTVPEPTGLTIAVKPESTTLQGPSTREEATAWQASGSLGNVRVSDDRRLDGAAWSLSGTASAFQSNSGGAPIPASNLGWAPSKVDGAGTQGPTIAPGTDGGLSTPQVLASGVGVDERNVSTTVAAGLTLTVPASAAGGAYNSTLTLTLI